MISPVLPVYNRLPLEIDYGKGSYLYTTDGKRYLDFIAGVATNSLGHCHPVLVNALKKQADKLWHISNIFKIPGLDDLASTLSDHSFADTMFFCNSGAEAIECAVKMVRKFHDATGNPDKFRVITFEGAFHGRTLTAISASKRDVFMQDGFGPLVEGFDHVPFNDIEAVKGALKEDTGAILLEPIQGDGGIRPADHIFLKQLRELADEHGLLLVFDEIQCGIGRTGKLFAYELADVKPDIMTIAKGVGGGFPLGACLATEHAAQGMTQGTHGSTFGGNPMAMAVGKAVLDEVLKEGFLASVQDKAEKLHNACVRLQKEFPSLIEEVRGVGLLKGLKVTMPNKDLIAALVPNGLLTAAASENVVRLLPPLTVESSQMDEAMAILDKTLREFS